MNERNDFAGGRLSAKLSGESVVYGFHAVEALLAANGDRVNSICLLKNRKDRRIGELQRRAEALGVSIRRVAAEQLLELSGEYALHQGVIALIDGAAPLGENWLSALLEQEQEQEHSQLFLVLDRVEDPRNLGACLRSAAGAGADAVIVPRSQAAGLSPLVRKVASGGAEMVPVVQVANLARALKSLQQAGVWTIGLDAAVNTELAHLDLCLPVALVLGGEGRGLRQLTTKHCDALACLPMNTGIGSLNVSVAAGIALYETLRQRGIQSQ